jgi:hypothetical protein
MSLVGCFINTTNTLPPGTEIQLQFNYKGATLKTKGAVVRSEPTMGFGVSFVRMKSVEETLLKKWLFEHEHGN